MLETVSQMVGIASGIVGMVTGTVSMVVGIIALHHSKEALRRTGRDDTDNES